MRTLIKAMRIGLAVALFSLLMWLPGKTLNPGGWRGPAPCCGQETGGTDPNPENLVMESYAGHDFTGQVSILNNAMTEVNGFHRVHILNSFQGFTGIAQVNQAAGALSNQVTYIGIAAIGGSPQAAGLRMSYVSRVQKNSLTTSNSTYQAHIKGASFASSSGIALVNQAAGHMNTQLTAFNLAIGGRATQEFTDVQLGAISSHNTLASDPEAPSSVRSIELEMEKGAFQNYTGIWGTSQIAGNLNQVTTIFNVRVITVP
jgi:hypothetical protein